MKPHTAIPVKDMNRSKMFYTMLGFSVTQEWQRPDWELQGCFVEHPSGLTVELIAHPKNAGLKFPAVAEVLHIAIPVANLDRSVEQLTNAGVTIARPVTPGITVKRLCFVKDPNGFSIELYEPK